MHVAALLLLVLSQTSVREEMERAVALLQSGASEEARSLFEAVVQAHPGHGPARLQLGRLAVARGEWENAREQLEIAVRAEPPPQRLFLAWHLLGRTRRALGDPEGAVEAFESALALAPNFTPARIQLAELAVSANDLWTALEQYRASGAMTPLANTARLMGALELARCAAGAALASEMTDAERGALLYLRAVIEQQSGDVEGAIVSVREALALGFDNAAIYLTLGNLYHEKMMLGEAIAAFEKGLEIDPEAAESVASFALSSLTTEQYGRLRSLLERHAAEHPESLNTLYGLGAMYLREGELEKAAKTFERLSRLVPRRSQVQYNLAMSYLRLGRGEDGRAAMTRFRELKAHEDAEWNRQNELGRARLRMKELVARGDDTGALALGLELAKAPSPEPDDLLVLGGALHRLGRDEEAEKVLDRALEKNPYDRKLLEALLGVAKARGDDGAIARYHHRLELLAPECSP